MLQFKRGEERKLHDAALLEGIIHTNFRRYGFRKQRFNSFALHVLHALVLFVVFYSVYPHVHHHHTVSYQPVRHLWSLYILPFFSFWSFFFFEITHRTNPGFATAKDRKMPSRHYVVCQGCRIPTPRRTQHCSSCRRCVLRRDSHSPLVGNCIGANNHIYYYMFLFSTVMETGIILSLLHHSLSLKIIYEGGEEIVWLFFGGLLSGYFAIFILLFCTQTIKIIKNVTCDEVLNVNEKPYLSFYPTYENEFDRGILQNILLFLTFYKKERPFW